MDPTATNTGLAAVPWLAVGKLGEDSQCALPSGEFLQRFLYEIVTPCYLGTQLKVDKLGDYAKSWPDRLNSQDNIQYPTMWLPKLPTYRMFKTIEDKAKDERHKKIEKGEIRKINKNHAMKVTNRSKHHTTAPLCAKLRETLRQQLPPEADAKEVDDAQKLMKSNLAASTRRTMENVEKILQNLIPNRDIFQDPQPGDRELLLLRLSQRRKRAHTTVLQYMKWYGSILRDKGHKPPADNLIFDRMAGGLKKRNLDPRRKAKKTRREAYSVGKLRLLGHALAQMREKKPGTWGRVKAQGIFAATLIAFWACARTADLCGAGPDEYSKKTTLLERDFRLMENDGKVEGLEVFFKSEKVPNQNGSRVQLPMVPDGPLTDLCPVSAYLEYQKAKESLEPNKDAPWLITDAGKPITQKVFVKSIKRAIECTYEGTEYEHLMEALKGHSLRAGLPTEIQKMASVLTKEESRLMGRWVTETAHQLYCKNPTGARYRVAQRVVEGMQRHNSESPT